MTNYFGHYPKLYVKNKRELFPIIEKYYGESIKGMTHNEVIGIYLDLLKYDPAFIQEVDLLAMDKYKNVFGIDTSGLISAGQAVEAEKEKSGLFAWIGDLFKKDESKTESDESKTESDDKTTRLSGGGGGGFFTMLGNLFTSVTNKQTAEQEGDNLFYETVLTEQKKDDTTKILIVSGIALAFVGLGVFMVVKMRE